MCSACGASEQPTHLTANQLPVRQQRTCGHHLSHERVMLWFVAQSWQHRVTSKASGRSGDRPGIERSNCNRASFSGSGGNNDGPHRGEAGPRIDHDDWWVSRNGGPDRCGRPGWRVSARKRSEIDRKAIDPRNDSVSVATQGRDRSGAQDYDPAPEGLRSRSRVMELASSRYSSITSSSTSSSGFRFRG
jgi:hypothetical protein